MTEKNQRIVFLDNANLVKIISDILTKNGLEETIQQAHNKFEKGETPITVVLSKAALDIATEKISTKNLPHLLQKELGIQKETAEKLSEDIKLQLVPLTTKVFVDPDETGGNKTISIEPARPPINTFEIQEKNIPTPIEKPKNKISIPSKNIKKPAISEEINKTTPQIKQPRGTDSYRETIG